MSESGSHSHPDDAMVDLLVKQVIEGLSPAEQRELEAFDALRAGEALFELEQAVAAVSLAGITLEEPPAALRALLERRGTEHIGTRNVVDFKRPAAASRAPEATDAAAVRDATPVRGDAGRSASWGWLAAAACLVLALFGWLRSPPPTVAPPAAAQLNPLSVPPALPPPEPPKPPTLAEARAALLASADTLKVTLAPTKDPAGAGVTGDAVWDPKSQQGFLHFVGLTGNDPSVKQYQIWVFDGKRDKHYPVDGGVFDVPANSAEVIIPIRAALTIGEAKGFAVTVEKPGGVVVSALGHVVAIGTAG
jgi:hypothetical protein